MCRVEKIVIFFFFLQNSIVFARTHVDYMKNTFVKSCCPVIDVGYEDSMVQSFSARPIYGF